MNLKVILAATAVGGLGVAAPAQAAFPGTNGSVLFGAYDMPATGVFDLPLGGQPTALVETGSDTPNHPHVSPDGTRLLYADGSYRTLVAGRNGSAPAIVTPEGEKDWTPTWAPDGTIVFAHPAEGTENLWELWRMDADGSDRRRIGGGISGTHPTVSPDGRWIVYLGGGEGLELYRIAADGSGEPEYLTEGRDADYTPDGSAVVFGTQLNWFDGALYRYDFATEEVTPITESGTRRFYSDPAVSPDGKRLVALSFDLRESRGPSTGGLRVMDIDGTDETPIAGTTTARDPFWAAATPAPAPAGDDAPATPAMPVAPATPSAAATQRAASSAAPRVCASRRFFTITVRGRAVRKVAIAVDGKAVAAKRRDGRFTARVDLRTLPKGRFAVTIRKTTAKGTRVETRRYRTCTPRQDR